MSNRVFLYNVNSENKDEVLEIGESANGVPLLWCLLFDIKDLSVSSTVSDGGEDDEEELLVELSCSTKKATESIKRKYASARKKEISDDVIKKLEQAINQLTHNSLVAVITEYSWFFETVDEMKKDLSKLLNLTCIETKFPSQTCAIDLAEIYETLELSVPGSIKELAFQPSPVKVTKPRIETFRPFDDEGNLLQEYILRSGFDPAYFNAENDHNPIVLHPCERCAGNGFVRVYDPPLGDITCDLCCGSGCEDKPRPMFDNNEIAYQTLLKDKFNECPGCGKRFLTYDKRRWSGLRHHCGQRILQSEV